MSKMGPSYANLLVGFIENKFFSNYHGPKPDPYKRYIDDISANKRNAISALERNSKITLKKPTTKL